MNTHTGQIVSAATLAALSADDRHAYAMVPDHLQADARPFVDTGVSVYDAAPRSALAQFGKAERRKMTRARHAARKQKRGRR